MKKEYLNVSLRKKKEIKINIRSYLELHVRLPDRSQKSNNFQLTVQIKKKAIISVVQTW